MPLTKKEPFRGSFFVSNEGGDSEWFIDYLKHMIPFICVPFMSERQRKHKESKQTIKKR